MDGRRKYRAMTKERFLFHEMRISAQLLSNGLSRSQAIDRIADENLYQYPTEKSLREVANGCMNRLEALNDASLVDAIATLPANDAKQVCLYAVMCQNLLFYDFMTSVIGEKYRTLDYTFSRLDLNSFFIRMQEQVDSVAAWSESSVGKTKSTIKGILVDTGFLEKATSSELKRVWLCGTLEEALRRREDKAAMAAFNYFL